jgi:glycosyltransferase involved in cell wall biosynthesis
VYEGKMTLDALKIRGPFQGPSGYEHHVREFVRELHRQGVELELEDLPEWGPAKLPPHLQDPFFNTLGNPVDARVVVQFCMPHQIQHHVRLVDVNYTMFEANRIPAHWVRRSQRCDMTVLPTESSRRAWAGSGVPADRLQICPLGIDPARFDGSAQPLDLPWHEPKPIRNHRMRFLNVSELGPRKNLVGLLHAWLLATTDEDDAVLILKLGDYAPGRRERLYRDLVTVERQVGKTLGEAAPIHFVYDVYSDDEMLGLFAAATHYISLSHGEGWDQAMMEAVASGLVPVAPVHSAYLTYLDATIAHLIPSREVPVVFDDGDELKALFAGASWWEPDVDEAAALVRALIDGRAGAIVSGRRYILSAFTWEKATARLLEIATAAADAGIARRFWQGLRGYSRV